MANKRTLKEQLEWDKPWLPDDEKPRTRRRPPPTTPRPNVRIIGLDELRRPAAKPSDSSPQAGINQPNDSHASDSR